MMQIKGDVCLRIEGIGIILIEADILRCRVVPAVKLLDEMLSQIFGSSVKEVFQEADGLSVVSLQLRHKWPSVSILLHIGIEFCDHIIEKRI